MKLIRLKADFFIEIIGNELGIYDFINNKIVWACRVREDSLVENIEDLYFGIDLKKVKNNSLISFLLTQIGNKYFEELDLKDMTIQEYESIYYEGLKRIKRKFIKDNAQSKLENIDICLVCEHEIFSVYFESLSDELGIKIVHFDELYSVQNTSYNLFLFCGNFKKADYMKVLNTINSDAFLIFIDWTNTSVRLGPLINNIISFDEKEEVLSMISTDSCFSVIPIHAIYLVLGILVKEIQFISNNFVYLLSNEYSTLLNNRIVIEYESLNGYSENNF
ncbi:hypothetical protein [Streptococcus salivarius]|uniref:hypothetical protein n=1 Tax=Streptococcus salivarius TaxID=1304 RepID=UPI000A09345F|nr:hypothetical protein [Streptococcus salivarius]ARI59910.1 hypothetical protein V471_06610 [Streptococcus salivarius]SQF75709.1 Uncharacterised protein [Streptococcus salivarius]